MNMIDGQIVWDRSILDKHSHSHGLNDNSEACFTGYVNTTDYSLHSSVSAFTALEYRAELLAAGMGQMQESFQ